MLRVKEYGPFISYETHRVIYDVIAPATFEDLDELFTDDMLDESKVAQFVIDNLHWVVDKQEFLDEVDTETIMDSVMDSYEAKVDNSGTFEVEPIEELAC